MMATRSVAEVIRRARIEEPCFIMFVAYLVPVTPLVVNVEKTINDSDSNASYS
jgi:hypothetical protein